MSIVCEVQRLVSAELYTKYFQLDDPSIVPRKNSQLIALS